MEYRFCLWSAKIFTKISRTPTKETLLIIKTPSRTSFHHNAIIMLANGDKAKIGTITAGYEHFHEWKRLAESDPGVVDMETLWRAFAVKRISWIFLKISLSMMIPAAKQIKVLAKNHQYLGVNQVIKGFERSRIESREDSAFSGIRKVLAKLFYGVFHYAKVHRKIGGNYTFFICTDRDDLDTQHIKPLPDVALPIMTKTHAGQPVENIWPNLWLITRPMYLPPFKNSIKK